MYCRKCGKRIPDDSNYCNYCGNKITLDKKEKRAIWLALLESKDAKVFQCLKLEIFIPKSHFSRLQEVLQRVDAGHIGNYDSCLSFSEVMSTWRPLKGTDPYIGSVGELSLEPEFKVEVTIRAENLEKTLSAIREVHPYEEPVINVIPLLSTGIMNQV